jgi:hypothetical protein
MSLICFLAFFFGPARLAGKHFGNERHGQQSYAEQQKQLHGLSFVARIWIPQ